MAFRKEMEGGCYGALQVVQKDGKSGTLRDDGCDQRKGRAGKRGAEAAAPSTAAAVVVE